MTVQDAATSKSPVGGEERKPLGKFIGESMDQGLVDMKSLFSFWTRIVDICDETMQVVEVDSGDVTVLSQWQQKWHRPIFKQLVLFTNAEYDRANINRDEYLLSLNQVADNVLANTIHIEVDREVFQDPAWLSGHISPGEARKKLDANLFHIEKLDGLEERSQTQSWYFGTLEGSDDFDISKVRKYAKHLCVIWSEIYGLWTEKDGRAMDTHTEAFKKSAVRAHRAWTAARIAEEKLNILFNDIPEELGNGEDKDELLVFSNRKSSEESQALIEELNEDIRRLDEADSKLAYEWTVR